MSSTLEIRLDELERKLEKQAFQIRIVQKLAANYDFFGLFDQILSYDLSEEDFNNIRNLTKEYEEKLHNHNAITLEEFTADFINILKSNSSTGQIEIDFPSFIPLWLKGPNGGFGFSKELHEHFY
ncbi:hypothetical protein [Viridibacillus arvi]|uniref:hypothetical protein n=1 Tax=Viridibacillus arvi TaxID=263475 RepID=UPI0034CE61BD